MIQEGFMSKITIYHGSDHIIEKPDINKGKKYNDYGQGFYCTEDLELAKEWACKTGKEGFVNEYELNTAGLAILNLNSNGYTILNWIALLLKYRTFTLDNEIQRQARDYIINNFLSFFFCIIFANNMSFFVFNYFLIFFLAKAFSIFY